MKKIIIATHNRLAEGLKNTLEYIAPNTVEIIDINAYLDDTPIEEQIEKALEQFEEDEQIFVFTDLLGGSVNQEFAKKISEKKIELISGVNLPVVLTIALSLSGGDVTPEAIRQVIEESRNQLVYVNDSLLEQDIDDEDE